MAAELSQLRAELAAARAENEQLRRGPDKAQGRRRYRVRELYREWYREGLPALRSIGKLSSDRVKLYRSTKRILLMTRVDLPDKRKRVRFGSLFVDELSPDVAWALRVALRQTKTRLGRVYQDNSINTYLSTLQSCLTWHGKNGRQIGDNPLSGTEMVDEAGFRRTARPSREEWSEIISPAPPLVRDILFVQFMCSMRPTEARELRRCEWFPDERRIVLSKRDGCKTGQRPIVVEAEVAEIINKRLAESRGEYVFVDSRDPEQLQPLGIEYVSRHARRARKFASTRDGRRVTPYDARHGGINRTLKLAAKARLTIADVAVHSGNSVDTLMTNYHHYDMDTDAQDALRSALEADAGPSRRLNR
jgi:hypothetical protein